MRGKIVSTLLWGWVCFFTHAQEPPQISFSGFLDAYYTYDFNRPATQERPDFIYNHKRHNEFSINMGLVQMDVSADAYRATLGLMVGTYAQYNLAEEQGLMQNIYEAYAGVALNASRSLWLDFGVFSSNLGFESAISRDNYTLTRSLFAEGSPYYLSGLRLTWQAHEKWELMAILSNGWQRIRRVEGNSLPALGTQITFTPSEKASFTWGTFIGSDDPDEQRRMRYFNNFYGQFQLSERVALVAGFDVGFQQAAKDSPNYQHWFTPVLIAKYQLNDDWAAGLRAEYYHDADQIIVSTAHEEGFQTSGFSLNFDRAIQKKALFRLEARWFHAPHHIFEREKTFVRDNFALTSSLSIAF